MKNYKISEISKISGVSVKALRGYEEKGLIVPTRQFESNYRIYSEEMILKIKNIKLLQDLGFSLKEIVLIHENKELGASDLKSLFKDQFEKTRQQITILNERKLILSNIIKKFEEEGTSSSSILTAKEKDVFMGITTGFSKLDQLLYSENKSELIVIAARPGMGKTALTVHIAYNLLEQSGLPICFFSTEFDHKEWVERLAIQKTKIDRYSNDLSNESQIELDNIRNEIKKKSIYFRHNKSIRIDEIIDMSLDINQDLGALVVDHYQDIEGDLESKCEKLKELSLKLNCPVLVISTVSDCADEREGKRPRPEDLKEYEYISNHYDKLLIVSQDPKMSLSQSKKIAHIDVYSKFETNFEHLNLVWDGAYCGYSDSI